MVNDRKENNSKRTEERNRFKDLDEELDVRRVIVTIFTNEQTLIENSIRTFVGG